VTTWLNGLGVNVTSQKSAVTVVKRLLNWAIEQNYLKHNPIASMRRPRGRRRDVFYTSDQWDLIRQQARGPLLDMLDFLSLTGCRPQEARAIEARHLHGDLVIFPTDESKGNLEPRVIYLVPQAKEIVERLAKASPEGPIFRNSEGRPWTKDAIKCRLNRISRLVGFRVIAYGARHSWATDALVKGGIDPISVAHLMGHKDATMVSRVYSHIAKNPDFLRQQAIKAIGNR
jgi:integrase